MKHKKPDPRNGDNEHMTQTHAVAWSRLQRISCYHASILPVRSFGWGRHKQITVPDVIRENVDILGNGTEEEIKARVLWYVMFYPEVFKGALQ